MSQAEEFCQQLQVRGRREIIHIVRQFRARRLTNLANLNKLNKSINALIMLSIDSSTDMSIYRFEDGSLVRLSDANIVEAVKTVTVKYWIGAA